MAATGRDPSSASETGAAPVDTAARILDVAERLVQRRGYNAFSYAAIAAELEITKASLHYHFRSKAELGERLVARYAARFAAALRAIDARGGDAPTALGAYVRLYGDVLREERMCLCGMLAAEQQTLPQPMRTAVIAFFAQNEAWLERVLEHGRADGTLEFVGSARETARSLVSGLEGAMLVARSHDDAARFERVASQLLASLAGVTPRRDG